MYNNNSWHTWILCVQCCNHVSITKSDTQSDIHLYHAHSTYSSLFLCWDFCDETWKINTFIFTTGQSFIHRYKLTAMYSTCYSRQCPVLIVTVTSVHVLAVIISSFSVDWRWRVREMMYRSIRAVLI